MNTRNQTEFNLYVRLELVGALDCPDVWRGDIHKHAFWEILFVKEGQCIVEIEDTRWQLGAGQAVLVQPLENHVFETCIDKTKLVYLGFQCETGDASWLEKDPGERLLLGHIQGSEYLQDLLSKIDSDTAISKCGVNILQGLLSVAEWMKNRSDNFCDADEGHKSILCMKTMKYIRANDDRFVSVNEIASSLYVTPHHLGMVFSAGMGQTILQYQQAYKMERAAILIRSGTLSLTDISHQLGFSSPQYFSKCFKNYYGFPPNQMKKFK